MLQSQIMLNCSLETLREQLLAKCESWVRIPAELLVMSERASANNSAQRTQSIAQGDLIGVKTLNR